MNKRETSFTGTEPFRHPQLHDMREDEPTQRKHRIRGYRHGHRRALSGDQGAFRRIVKRYQRAVFAVSLSRLHDFHAAEDVAQQVFLDAFERLTSIKDPAKLGGWLRTIAIRRAIGYHRAKRDWRWRTTGSPKQGVWGKGIQNLTAAFLDF